jgi:hypothetical protein
VPLGADNQCFYQPKPAFNQSFGRLTSNIERLINLFSGFRLIILSQNIRSAVKTHGKLRFYYRNHRISRL